MRYAKRVFFCPFPVFGFGICSDANRPVAASLRTASSTVLSFHSATVFSASQISAKVAGCPAVFTAFITASSIGGAFTSTGPSSFFALPARYFCPSFQARPSLCAPAHGEKLRNRNFYYGQRPHTPRDTAYT